MPFDRTIEPTPRRSFRLQEDTCAAAGWPPRNRTQSTSDQLFSLAVEAAELRIRQRYNNAVTQSTSALELDKYCANETVVCWGTPSRAAQERIAGRYLAKVNAATLNHNARVGTAQATYDQAMRQLQSIKSTYQSAGDKDAVVQFAIAQLQEL